MNQYRSLFCSDDFLCIFLFSFCHICKKIYIFMSSCSYCLSFDSSFGYCFGLKRWLCWASAVETWVRVALKLCSQVAAQLFSLTFSGHGFYPPSVSERHVFLELNLKKKKKKSQSTRSAPESTVAFLTDALPSAATIAFNATSGYICLLQSHRVLDNSLALRPQTDFKCWHSCPIALRYRSARWGALNRAHFIFRRS